MSVGTRNGDIAKLKSSGNKEGTTLAADVGLAEREVDERGGRRGGVAEMEGIGWRWFRRGRQ